MFQVYHEGHAKVQQDEPSQGESQMGRGRCPNVDADRNQEQLHDPGAEHAPFSARMADAEKKIIRPTAGGFAVRAGGLAESPCNGQHIGQIINDPAADPANNQWDDYTSFHIFIIFQKLPNNRGA